MPNLHSLSSSTPSIHHYQAIDITKFLLIIGVVLIHSNLFSGEISNDSNANKVGILFVEFFSTSLSRISVPVFFILSGYLFFNNSGKFSITTYRKKLKRRFFTLLIPYLLWNTFGIILSIAKTEYLGFPSYEIIVNGHINFLRVAESYWVMTNGYPAAFAFWFIRNLIIFVILSPLIYLFVENKAIFIAVLLIAFATNTTGYGILFFLIGARLGRCISLPFSQLPLSLTIYGTAIWIGVAIIDLIFPFHRAEVLTLTIECLGGIVAIMGIADHFAEWIFSKRICRLLVSSTFFIYAFHQFFCTAVRNFYIKLFGIESFFSTIESYLASILTLIMVPFITWLLLKKYFPHFLSILTGNRH